MKSTLTPMAQRTLPAMLLVVVLASAVLVGTGAPPASAAVPVPYDGPSWMPRVGIVGDSLVYTTTPEIKQYVRNDWWRDATHSFPGVRVDTMRDQIRSMAADSPEAFVLVLGGLDSLALKDGVYDWNYQLSQIRGALDDLSRARVGCVVWVGPNENFDGGWLDYWAARINDEVQAQLAQRGIGVFGDWTAKAAGHPEYFLSDGAHFTASGKAAFSSLIRDRLRDCNGNPKGVLDSVRGGVGSLQVTGWGYDPDTADPLGVHVYVDGQFKGAFDAAAHRPDVGAANPYVGSNRGYDIAIPMTSGTHTACVFGIDEGAYGYKNTLLGCRSAVVPRDPVGWLDTASAAGPGAVSVTGWSIDPDTASPVGVHVYVDGQFGGSVTADGPRPDVGAAFPGFGNNHGFAASVGGLERGDHQVCVWAINASGTPGANSSLGCRIVHVPYGVTPMGAYDSLSGAGAGAVRLRGWAIDPEVVSAVQVHVYVDWTFRGAYDANASRADVGSAFPGYGDNHGFDVTVGSIPAGGREVCLFAINASGTAGDNLFLGCRRVAVT